MKKTSVIVPIYGVENYLTACITSIKNQTYQNLEIILVDDGSPDNCPTMCDELAKTDDRIKVVHKENGGLSDARNAGLDVATGDYIAFVDSDDTIEADMIELLVKNLEQYEADVSCCRYTKVWEDGREEKVGEDHELRIYDGIEGLKAYLYAVHMDPFVCNKLYRAELLNGEQKHRFIKGIIGEDNPFNIDIFKKTKKVVSAGKAKYRYLQQRSGAITNVSVSQKKMDAVFFWDSVRRDCEQHYPELTVYAVRRQALFYIGLYNRLGNDKNYQAERETIRTFLREQQSLITKSNICERVLKISTTLIVKAPWLYRGMMKLYKKVVGEAKL